MLLAVADYDSRECVSNFTLFIEKLCLWLLQTYYDFSFCCILRNARKSFAVAVNISGIFKIFDLNEKIIERKIQPQKFCLCCNKNAEEVIKLTF